MAADDFDIASLAKYLHLNPDQVLKMAEGAKLPGRKHGGEWKFSEAEVHHWLETRIAESSETELVAVEGVLDQGRPHESPSDAPICIAALLPQHAIAKPLAARTRNGVVHDMVELAAGTGWLWDPEKMEEAVRARESLHPTAIEHGVALLHPRRPLASILAEPFLALGITSTGIPFGAERGGLTDIFFSIQATTDREHLRILARLSRLVGDSEFLTTLRGAGGADEVRRAIIEREKQFDS